ncbi:glycosyltransferase [Chloroflexota bacterium]
MLKASDQVEFPLADGTVYSKRKGVTPFSSSKPEEYTSIIGQEKIERLLKVAARLKGLQILEVNASAQGGGVAEILLSIIPFMNSLGIDAEWKVITGNPDYFECTKSMHNLLQGMDGSFTSEMEQTYLKNLEVCGNESFIDYRPDVVTIHDPQPLGLTHYIKKPDEIWLWRCHIDIEQETLEDNPSLFSLILDLVEHYDASIFSTAHYVVSRWDMPKFVIPPFIDPLSDKNKDLTELEIQKVLDTYGINAKVPIIAQIGRFDPWKGIDRTIASYRQVKKERDCQLIIAGGTAIDDPEGIRILAQILEETKDDENIHVLNLPADSNIAINGLQRAADVIMQPSTKEGFGLVVTEALWKSKPLITGNIGGIPLQVSHGNTGFFYENARETAKTIISLLDNPEVASGMGACGRQYVKEHFLMPDRIADYLLALELLKSGTLNKETCGECIISYHPWFKLSKRHNTNN